MALFLGYLDVTSPCMCSTLAQGTNGWMDPRPPSHSLQYIHTPYTPSICGLSISTVLDIINKFDGNILELSSHHLLSDFYPSASPSQLHPAYYIAFPASLSPFLFSPLSFLLSLRLRSSIFHSLSLFASPHPSCLLLLLQFRSSPFPHSLTFGGLFTVPTRRYG